MAIQQAKEKPSEELEIPLFPECSKPMQQVETHKSFFWCSECYKLLIEASEDKPITKELLLTIPKNPAYTSFHIGSPRKTLRKIWVEKETKGGKKRSVQHEETYYFYGKEEAEHGQ